MSDRRKRSVLVPAHLEAGDGYEPFAMVQAPAIVSISDPNAEQATIAAVMLTPGYPNTTYVRLAAAGVDEESFGVPKHAVIWQALRALNDRGSPVDIITLVEELRTMAHSGRLNAIGGAQYLGELTDFIPTLAHCEAHAEIVILHALLRRALSIAQEMILVGTGEGSIQDRLARMNSLGTSIPSGVGRAKRVWIAEHLQDGLEDLEKIMLAKASGKFIAARFGVDTLDGSPDGRLAGMLNGIFPQNVLTIFGAPGSGKTTLAAQAAVVTAQDALAAAGGEIGKSRRVVMYCTEMLGPQVAMRLACARGGVDFNRLRSGQCTQDEMDRVFVSMNDIGGLPIDIIDTKVNRGRLTADDIHSSVHSMIAKGIEIALVVIDYFQDLGRCRGMEKTGDTQEQEARAAKIHDTAVSASVPIVLVSSTDKQTQKDHAAGGKSNTTNTRGAGLDFASDVMMGLVNLSNVAEKQDDDGRGGGKKGGKKPYKEPEEPPPDGCVYTRGDIVKNRYGGSGEVIFLFDKRHGMFRDHIKHRDGSIPDSAPDSVYDDVPFDPSE